MVKKAFRFLFCTFLLAFFGVTVYNFLSIFISEKGGRPGCNGNLLQYCYPQRPLGVQIELEFRSVGF